MYTVNIYTHIHISLYIVNIYTHIHISLYTVNIYTHIHTSLYIVNIYTYILTVCTCMEIVIRDVFWNFVVDVIAEKSFIALFQQALSVKRVL